MNDLTTENDRVRKKFQQVKIMTLVSLMKLLGCSRSTVQRRLRQWGCYTSYNRNGSFYTLSEVAKFNEYGLWQYSSVCFSRHGNLTQTVIALVNEAPAGMTATELTNILNVKAQSFIGAFAEKGKLSRQKLGSCFVYTSCDEFVRNQQIRTRREADQHRSQLNCADAVTVLVQLIKNPDLGAAELARKVRAEAPSASPEAIEHFFYEHNLISGKKKDLPHLGQ